MAIHVRAMVELGLGAGRAREAGCRNETTTSSVRRFKGLRPGPILVRILEQSPTTFSGWDEPFVMLVRENGRRGSN